MNKPARILIVEDESIIAEELRRIVIQLGYEVLAVAHRYSEAIEIMKQQIPDLVLLDIGLDYSKNDGIDLAEYINIEYKIPFIYITANTDILTVTKAKKTQPAAYIPKPFNKDVIFANIEIVLHKHYSEQVVQSITISQGTKKTVVSYREIVFLKADNVYTEIHTRDGKTFLVRKYLKTFLASMSARFIVQTHRSYAVNINFLESYTADHVFIPDQKLPLSSSYKKQLVACLPSGN